MSIQYHEDLDAEEVKAMVEKIKQELERQVYIPMPMMKVERTFPRGWIKLTSDRDRTIRINSEAMATYGTHDAHTLVTMIAEADGNGWFKVTETSEEIDKLIAESQGDQ